MRAESLNTDESMVNELNERYLDTCFPHTEIHNRIWFYIIFITSFHTVDEMERLYVSMYSI